MPLAVYTFGDAAGGPGTTDVSVPDQDEELNIDQTYFARLKLKANMKLLRAIAGTVTTAKLRWAELRGSEELFGPGGFRFELDATIADAAKLKMAALPGFVVTPDDQIQVRINNGSTAEQNAVAIMAQYAGGAPLDLNKYKAFRGILVSDGSTCTAGAWKQITDLPIPARTLSLTKSIKHWDLVTATAKGATTIAAKFKLPHWPVYSGVFGDYGITVATPTMGSKKYWEEPLIVDVPSDITALPCKVMALAADTATDVYLEFGGY
jgi:hypothetical protein